MFKMFTFSVVVYGLEKSEIWVHVFRELPNLVVS